MTHISPVNRGLAEKIFQGHDSTWMEVITEGFPDISVDDGRKRALKDTIKHSNTNFSCKRVKKIDLSHANIKYGIWSES